MTKPRRAAPAAPSGTALSPGELYAAARQHLAGWNGGRGCIVSMIRHGHGGRQVPSRFSRPGHRMIAVGSCLEAFMLVHGGSVDVENAMQSAGHDLMMERFEARGWVTPLDTPRSFPINTDEGHDA